MLTIFVLEDDLFQQFRIETAIKTILKKNGWRCRPLNIFGKPRQLIDTIAEHGSHQLFFLDIHINNELKKGFDIAQEIRTMDPYATIVFTTSHSEFLPVTFQYKVAALDFIDKSLDEEEYLNRIESAIAVTMTNMGKSVMEDSFVFETSLAAIQVPFHNILYFETSPTIHKVILHTKDERIEFYARLSQIERLDKRLFKCHKSFVVNPENITRINKETGEVFFENNDSCYVSKIKQKKLIEKIKQNS
ncbi:response regulator transcription factor [Streptococcus sp. H49]|uniref:response regulator transcription factor n=1 Tax=Streptococcus huangxiaojuni TaxID=3237239 RepID=UPI0034A24DA7